MSYVYFSQNSSLLYLLIIFSVENTDLWTSSQDGGIHRYTLPACTTKRKKPTNLKTKNNHNFQKMELYGSLTNKQLKKKHSFRLVGGAETGSGDREDVWQRGS